MSIREKQLDEVEICFGTIFRMRNLEGEETGRPRVVVDVGEGDDFEVASIRQDAGGQRTLGIPGTCDPAFFGSVIGIMSAEEVINLAKRTAQLQDREREFLVRGLVLYQESARKGPRKLLLNR